MASPQFQPHTEQSILPGTLVSRQSAFGLGITTGILGILSSFWVAILAIGMSMYAASGQEYGGGRLFVISGVLGAVFSIVAALMFVLGILTIVRNKQRSPKMPAALLVTAVIAVIIAIVAGVLGYTGGSFWVVTTVLMLPVIIVALLAFLAARAAQQQNSVR